MLGGEVSETIEVEGRGGCNVEKGKEEGGGREGIMEGEGGGERRMMNGGGKEEESEKVRDGWREEGVRRRGMRHYSLTFWESLSCMVSSHGEVDEG